MKMTVMSSMEKDVDNRVAGKVLLAFLMIPWQALSQPDDFLQKKVTIEVSSITLEKALDILSISYGVEFSYSDDVIPAQTQLTLQISNETITTALEHILSPYRIGFKITGRRIILKRSRDALTQKIRGRIVDQVTSVPIPGVTVMVQNTSPLLGVTTTDRGEFTLDHVPIGRVTLVIQSVGYDSKTIDQILLGTGKELVLEIRLQESVTAMNEIIVVGSRNEGIPGNGLAVTSAHTFTQEQTKQYAGSLGDPARMASSFAGVVAGSDEGNALIVRGNSPRGVLWRVDGIEVPNPNHFSQEGSSSGVVSILSPNMIDNSDFLTGAFPAQYGNSLAAVFDINLRNGNNQRREHSVQAGVLGLEVSTEGPFSRNNPSSYLVNYRYSTLSVLDGLGVELNEAGQYKSYQDLAFKLHWPTQNAGTFSLFSIGGISNARKSDGLLSDNNGNDIGTIGLTHKRVLNDRTLLQSALSFSGTRISRDHEVSGLLTSPLSVEENYVKSYVRSSLSVRRKMSSKYYIDAGVIFSTLQYNFFLRNTDPQNVYTVILNFSERGNTLITQGYVYAQQYISPSLMGFYGFHGLHFELSDDFSLEPRAGLRWQPGNSTSVSLGFGKHSRVENLQYYLARDHQTGGDEVQINRNLRFTRADHYVLSVEQKFSDSYRNDDRMSDTHRADNHRLKFEVYYQNLYNTPVQADPASLYATINEDSGFITDTLVNAGKGKNYGVELSLERTFHNNFYYLLNGSLYESTFKIDGQRTGSRNTAYNGNFAIHALAGKEYQLGSARNTLGLNMKLTAAGGRPYVPVDAERSKEEKKQVYNWDDAFEYRLPHYFRTDLQIVYRLNRQRCTLEWRLDIQNVTNHRNSAYYYFDPVSESVRLKKQVGLIPVLSYRMEF